MEEKEPKARRGIRLDREGTRSVIRIWDPESVTCRKGRQSQLYSGQPS